MADERPPRNPFRNEADAFRLLVMVVAAGAVVVALTLLTSPGIGFALALVLIVVGLWRAVGLFQDWRRRGSNPG
ncbi:hypothetical protein BH20ACT15_BH20ACT15_04150 [soil metagenome]